MSRNILTMDLNQTTPGKPRILIIGGGFAGLNLAKKLDGKDVEVMMLDRHNYHTFQPLLYQVAMGEIEADAIGFPIRRIFKGQKNFTFHLCEVQKIDSATNTVATSVGDIKYDYLVIATGSNTNFFGNDQIEKYTMPMKNIPEALNIRSLIIQNLEKATVTSDPVEHDALLTFVVVGGGPTGVELSGALADTRNHVLRQDFPSIKSDQVKIYLAEGKPQLLAAMSDQAQQAAKKFLTDRGVTVFNSVHVKSYDGETLTIDNGDVIKTRNVFWAAGVRGELPEGMPKEAVGKGSRLQTDEINRVKGFQNIFAIGDISQVVTDKNPEGYPGVAQVAIQQGRQLAANLIRIIGNQPTVPFKYNDKGTLATLGRNHAVADLGKLKFQGFVAWVLWLFVHLLSLAGFSNKLIVFVSWATNYINKNSDNRLVVRYFDTKTMMTDPIAR